MLLIILLIICIHHAIANPLLGPHEEVSSSEFPFVVCIAHKNQNHHGKENHICGGTLMSNTHVITSEFCVRNKDANNLQVLVGSTDLHSGEKYDVASVTFYDSWAKEHNVTSHVNNDIAILTLSKKVVDMSPGLLFKRANSRFYGLIATTVGWGETDSEESPQYLQKTNLKILSQEECAEYLKKETDKEYRFHERYLCSISSDGSLIAKGDNGGPLLIESAIIAINDGTFPYKEDVDGKVNVHLSAAYYQKFIESKIQGVSADE